MLSHILTLVYIRKTHAGWSSLTWILNATYQIGQIHACITLQDVFNIIIIINNIIIIIMIYLSVFFYIFLYSADTYICVNYMLFNWLFYFIYLLLFFFFGNLVFFPVGIFAMHEKKMYHVNSNLKGHT